MATECTGRCWRFALLKLKSTISTHARSCLASLIFILAKKPLPWVSAKRCDRRDYITSTHRGHGHCLAKGAAPHLMFAELLGKEAGYCKGKGRLHAHRRPGNRKPGS